MNPEHLGWDYWDSPDPERPPIPWHKALPGATHALWSEDIGWYFWRVQSNGTTKHDINKTGHWHTHQDQFSRVGSQQKLRDYLKTGKAVRRADDDQPDTTDEGYTPMNLNNAALLVRDDITTVEVTVNNKEMTAILHNSVQAAVGDQVFLNTDSGPRYGEVTRYDAEPQIDVNSNMRYCWVLGNISDSIRHISPEIERTHTIARALKQRQAANVRDQILAQFGVTNAAELMALGSDNAQSE